MRNFILGILTVILFQGAANYLDYRALDNDRADNQEVYNKVHHITFTTVEYLQLTPLVHVFTGRCRKGLANDRGITTRQWFGCNVVQNKLSDLIYKE